MNMFFKNKGILGINARNLLYIRPYNKKKAIRLADDKIKTKQFLSTREVPVPKLYGIIKDGKDLEKFDFNSLPTTFVLKPNKGFGGEGIIPVTDKRDKFFITAGGRQLSQEDLVDHTHDILDGRYSISNVGDYAFMEQYIEADERIGKYSYEGLPDIRVVVHNLIPVMAMLRLPTKESEGKANLHLGAVGVGIDIAKGEATYISYKNKVIDELPDGLGKIRGLKIPYWDEILLIASKVQLLTNLGYMAIDICIDKNTGPVLLEINARAGLGVQIANLAPLRRRLERIQGVKVLNPTKGVRIAKDMFGNIVEKEIEHLSGKQVIGTQEEVEIIQKSGTIRIDAKVDTNKNVSELDTKFAIEMGLIKEDHDKSTHKLKFSLKDRRLQTVVELKELEGDEVKMIIGNRDLKEFLIDTSQDRVNNLPEEPKKKAAEIKSQKPQINYSKVDQQLIDIDSKIKLLYHLKPLNLEREKADFLKGKIKNPQFEYPPLKFDPVELSDQLEKVKIENDDLGTIFKDKKREIDLKIKLLESIGEEAFTEHSKALYGFPSQAERDDCIKKIADIDIEKQQKDKSTQSAEDAKKKFEQIFEKYGLRNWKVKLKESMVADCVAGKNNRLFVRSAAKFSKARIEALIVHEIETHILTAENGKLQQFEIFNRGLANYLKTQEGLAMYNVETQRKTPFDQNFAAMTHVITINLSLNMGFREVYEKLLTLGIPSYTAFKSCLKCKRGFYDTSKAGAFTKDYVYYKGYHQVKSFVENGGDIKDLYIGKLDLEDLEKIKKLKQISGPKILPNWMKN
jgi:alpha-L-glutamate ligase-like protein/uncharacterized protein (TIGR02421 family)